MSLPHFAPFPEAKIRQSILPDEWELYLGSWTALCEFYLRLDEQKFLKASMENESFASFLVTFFHELAIAEDLSKRIGTLRKKCFLLLHRLLSGRDIPESLLKWTVLADECRIFLKSEQFRTLIHELWARKGPVIEKTLQLAKISLIRNLESKRPEEAEGTLNRIVALLRVSTDASMFMLAGSDFLDAMYESYPRTPEVLSRKLVTITYLSLISALEGPNPKYSLLSDHLYSLKANEEREQKQQPGKKTLVADLVTNTPFLTQIREKASAPAASRLRNTAAGLDAFRQSSMARPKKLIPREPNKGKAKQDDDDECQSMLDDEVHIHRMSLVAQIQDLFPDLGDGFIVKLLDEYNENLELVTAHLLEDSLPPHLANADRSEKLSAKAPPRSHLPPKSSQTHERRNVFDNDEFDQLAVDTSRIHIGRKGQDLNADKILSDRSKVPAKASILAALSAFDADDDERDDTYDVEDVGASVDNAADEANADLADKNEEALFRAYAGNPKVFERDGETRRSKARAALKTETGMTDEALEGWAIMLHRYPKRIKRLEDKYNDMPGVRGVLEYTAWRQNDQDTGDEEGEGNHGERGDAGGRGGRGGGGGGGGRGRGRGRGRGGGGRGRGGGNVAGPSNDKNTQIARDKKDANKASRANHNRKAQRDKKMARGGFPG